MPLKGAGGVVIAVSMVVDGLDAHYYKMQLLLSSLARLTSVQRSDVCVFCTDRVSRDFVSHLAAAGYRTATVTPYLDGKFCNKLQQLPELLKIFPDANGYLLLDNDICFAGDIDLDGCEHIRGKVVDDVNPPIGVLQRIFSEAGLPQPATRQCDFGNGPTFATNFNGGVLFIPKSVAGVFSSEWRRWATWLFARPGLLDTDRHRAHIDQISFCMALAASGLPWAPLPTNLNCPGHQASALVDLDGARPVAILHYHSMLDEFGRLDAPEGCNAAVESARARINDALDLDRPFLHFAPFKKSRTRQISLPARGHPLRTGLEARARRFPERLILHAGTTKTGTTSLQVYLDGHREQLKAQGILYPSVDGSTVEPKHQWIVLHLLQNDGEKFAERLFAALDEADEHTHTVILSTEGIFNHWWDFGPEARGMLALLAAHSNIELWAWFREPVSFSESFYVQAMKNPRVLNIPTYGHAITPAQALDDHWFRRHLDYAGFLCEVEEIFGEGRIVPMAYGRGTVEDACRLLGVEIAAADETSVNRSVGKTGIDLLGILNEYELTEPEKRRVTVLVEEIDRVVGERSARYRFDETSRKRVSMLTVESTALLKARFGLDVSVAR